MTLAFLISADDVINVLHSNAVKAQYASAVRVRLEFVAIELLQQLDFSQIDDAALAAGTSLEDQTDGAHDEIARQLRAAGILEPLPAADAPKARA